MFKMFQTSRLTNNNHNRPPDNNDTNHPTTATQTATISSSCRQQQLLVQTHPNVQLPRQFQDQSRREQIERSCRRFMGYPMAVNTMYKTLKKIQTNPTERKYRRIDTKHAGYQRSLANLPGTEALLRAINFRPCSLDNSIWTMRHLDPTLLQWALTCLERTKQTPEYQHAKTELEFAKQLHQHLRAFPSEDELALRSVLLSYVPLEASEGRGTLIHVTIPTFSQQQQSRIVQRRFDADDTLLDVIHW
eukprot:CAMPEP_0194244286 /NCGR_PEP_ID=MMETSP0158-20130606/10804_1 /TAXON_ID=33649 /ORGANISM="Thalassionema nitzschioides, Strain L26-B" /LENGTH=246 /DNA_ID=CAMNT_0038979719 /DNA_START=1 /DNA_END=738 /DNA_ORIENTATION=+